MATTLLIKINGTAKSFLDELDKVKKGTKSAEKVLKETAKASGLAFAALTAVVAGTTKAFADYETALVGVGKTTGLEGKALAKFGKTVQELSRRIPVATDELLGIAQAAGQLGVKGEENLLKFTETMAKLAVTTDLSGEAAAQSIARVLNITGEGINTVDEFGSVLVSLGNNSAAVESQILSMTLEVAKSLRIFDVSAARSAALGTALREVGVRAELGGSALGRTFRALQKALRTGGAGLQEFERITGRTGEDLRRIFEEDATEGFLVFLDGLKALEDQSKGASTDALAKFGLKGEEILKVLPTLAIGVDKVRKAFKLQSDEAGGTAALNAEAAAAFDTLTSDAKLLGNSVTELGVKLGAEFAGDVRLLVNEARGLVESLNDMDEETIGAIATFIEFATAVTGLIAALASFGLIALQVVKGLGAIKLFAKTVGVSLAALGAGASIAIVAITGLVRALAFEQDFSSLEKVNEQLFKTRTQLEKTLAIQKELGKENDEESKRFTNALREQIRLLEERRTELARTDKDFGTGKLLLRTEVASDELDLDLPGAQKIPFEFGDDGGELAATKKIEDNKNEIIDEARQKRLQNRRNEQDILLAIAGEDGEAQADFLRRQQEIDQQFREAKQIADKEERDIAIKNAKIANETLTVDRLEFSDQQAVLDEDQRSRVSALDTFTVEQRAALSTQLIGATKKEQETLLKEREQHNKNVNVLRSQNVNHALGFAAAVGDAIISATGDNFAAGIALAKAFAITDILIKDGQARGAATVAGANSAIAAAFLGPEAAAAAAAATYATLSAGISAGTALALGTVAAQTFAQVQRRPSKRKAAQGGITPRLIGDSPGSGIRDRIETSLEPGELVTPKALVPDFIQAVGRPEVFAEDGELDEDGGSPGSMHLTIGFRDNAFDLIEVEQNERTALNITQRDEVR